MKCREVKTHRGEWFTLTEEEEKYVRTLERLSKMSPGRIELMGNGTLSVRIAGCWYDENIGSSVNTFIKCEGGDSGD